MQHPIRVYDPQYLHEITLRINGGDYLLNMNSRSLRRLIQGALAKYAIKYNIKVIAFHFLSNQYRHSKKSRCRKPKRQTVMLPDRMTLALLTPIQRKTLILR